MAALQRKVKPEIATKVGVSEAGTDGAAVSGSVETESGVERAETLPAASRARTVSENVVAGASAVKEREVAVVRPRETPLRKTS